MAKMMEEGIFVEDCVAFMSRMDEASIDLTVTSPPDVVFFERIIAYLERFATDAE